MTEKADRELVGAEETVRSFHQKKETEKHPQLPTLPHSTQCLGWADPTGHHGLWAHHSKGAGSHSAHSSSESQPE